MFWAPRLYLAQPWSAGKPLNFSFLSSIGLIQMYIIAESCQLNETNRYPLVVPVQVTFRIQKSGIELALQLCSAFRSGQQIRVDYIACIRWLHAATHLTLELCTILHAHYCENISIAHRSILFLDHDSFTMFWWIHIVGFPRRWAQSRGDRPT